MPFLGPEAIASLLTVAGRASLVGASNLLLREAGLVSWSDLFDGHGDPRAFSDVVRRQGLTREQLRRAGFDEATIARLVPPW